MKVIKNRIYLLKTAQGSCLYHTSTDDMAQIAGEFVEVTPVYAGKDGFMLGEGERVTNNVYVSTANRDGGYHNAHRNLLRWKKSAYANGVWHVVEGTEICFDHYVAGRDHADAELTFTAVKAHRSGAAVLETLVGGKWVEFVKLDRQCTVTNLKLPAGFCHGCPQFRVRGLAGCDLDWCGYDLTTRLSGLPANSIGKTSLW